MTFETGLNYHYQGGGSREGKFVNIYNILINIEVLIVSRAVSNSCSESCKCLFFTSIMVIVQTVAVPW